MCDILADVQGKGNSHQTNQLCDAIVNLRSLRCLDISKNKFYTQTLDHLLTTIHKLPNLDTLVLNKVGLADENIMSFLMMISKAVCLKKLNISNNKDLSPNSIG